MNNNNCFDFLRFFFAANIVLAHLCELSQSKDLQFLANFSNSGMGVKGFFVVSGFLVAKSYVNTPSLKEYFIKRAKRILPAYIFIVFFATFILCFFSYYSFFQYFTDANTYKYLGWNLIFCNFMHPCLPGLFENNLLCVVNGSLWTLKVEEGFYVILPLVFYAINRLKKPSVVLISLYIFSLLYWFVMEDYFGKPLLAKQLPGYLSYFVVGIFLFLNFIFIQKHKNTLLIVAVLSLSLSSLITAPINIIYPAAFGVLVIVFAYSLPFANHFGKYGDFTYGIYIFHFPIIQLFRQYNLFEKYNPILMAFFVILLTLSFAVFSWFFIEKRFLDRFKNKESKQVLAVC